MNDYPQRSDDLELERIESEDEDSASSPPEYKIVTYPADYTLEVLHNMWTKEELTVPPFQRYFVWNRKKASRLVESFLADLPVPPIFLFREETDRKLLVIDGQQRLRSIFSYFEGRFAAGTTNRSQVFRLTGLNRDSPFHDKAFDELDEAMQRTLKNCVLRSFVVRQLDPDDDTSIYHIFERLNTGGALLVGQEIRECVFHGPFAVYLDEINRLPAWRKILGRDQPDTRKRDRELILRFLALHASADAYKTPMKEYLNRFMKKNRHASAGRLAASKALFERTCEDVVESLGERPFHVRKALNAAVFDAVMVAFSRHPGDVPEDASVRYRRLVRNQEFEEHTRIHTTDVDVVHSRLEQAEEALFGR